MQIAGLGSSRIRLYEVSSKSFTRCNVSMWVAAQSVLAVVVEISMVSLSNPASRSLKLFTT